MAFPQDLDFLQDPEDPKVQDELWPPISKLPSFEPCYSILAISFIFQFLGSVPQNGWDHLKFGDLTHRLTNFNRSLHSMSWSSTTGNGYPNGQRWVPGPQPPHGPHASPHGRACAGDG